MWPCGMYGLRNSGVVVRSVRLCGAQGGRAGQRALVMSLVLVRHFNARYILPVLWVAGHLNTWTRAPALAAAVLWVAGHLNTWTRAPALAAAVLWVAGHLNTWTRAPALRSRAETLFDNELTTTMVLLLHLQHTKE